VKEHNKFLETIWGDYDSSDPTDKILLGFGYFWLVVILIMAGIDIWNS